jgi:hypothetical protein
MNLYTYFISLVVHSLKCSKVDIDSSRLLVHRIVIVVSVWGWR